LKNLFVLLRNGLRREEGTYDVKLIGKTFHPPRRVFPERKADLPDAEKAWTSVAWQQCSVPLGESMGFTARI
jgi:hypothetical protein